MALKTPQQARSRRTLARVERAAIALISEGGLDAANVQDIARRADSSVGSFYSRFDGKDDLIAHLHHRLWDDVSVRWAEATADEAAEGPSEPSDPSERPDLPASLQTIVLGLFHAFESDARARRLVGAKREATSDDRPSRPVLAAIRQAAVARVLEHADELARPDSTLAADVLMRAWIAAVQSFADDATAPADRPAREILAGELVAMAVSYLSGRTGADDLPDTPEGMEFFDVWS